MSLIGQMYAFLTGRFREIPAMSERFRKKIRLNIFPEKRKKKDGVFFC